MSFETLQATAPNNGFKILAFTIFKMVLLFKVLQNLTCKRVFHLICKSKSELISVFIFLR